LGRPGFLFRVELNLQNPMIFSSPIFGLQNLHPEVFFGRGEVEGGSSIISSNTRQGSSTVEHTPRYLVGNYVLIRYTQVVGQHHLRPLPGLVHTDWAVAAWLPLVAGSSPVPGSL
jgi:hypothetical protein